MTEGHRAQFRAGVPRRRFIRMFGGTAVLALAACNQPGPTPATNAAPTAGRVSPQATPTPAGHRLRIAWSFTVPNLNPVENHYGLLAYGAAQSLNYLKPDETIAPWIASEMERNGDEGWTIKLNPAAKFQNGKVIDAKAVQACLQRYIEAGTSVSSLKGASFEVVDSGTLRIKTSGADAWLPYQFAGITNFAIFDVTEVPPNADPASLIGKGFLSGPFKVRSLSPDQMTLDAWSEAWDGAPKLAGIDVRFVTDPQARLAALKAGDIDLMLNVPSAQLPEINATSGISIKKAPDSNSQVWMVLNNRQAPFDDVAVRRAVNLAIDRKQIAENVLNGAYDALDGFFPATSPWNVAGLLKTDVAAAKKTLDDAGWAPGSDGIRKKSEQRLTFELLYYPQRPDFKPIAEAIQSELTPIGMDVKVKQVDDVDSVLKGTGWNASIYGCSTQFYGNPMYGLERRFSTTSPDNLGAWGSAELDALINKLRVEFDPDRRSEMLKQAQAILARDVPVVFTVAYPNQVAVNTAYANYVVPVSQSHYFATKDTSPVG